MVYVPVLCVVHQAGFLCPLSGGRTQGSVTFPPWLLGTNLWVSARARAAPLGLCAGRFCPRALRAFSPGYVPGVTNEVEAQLGSIQTFLEKQSFHKGLCLNKNQKT